MSKRICFFLTALLLVSAWAGSAPAAIFQVNYLDQPGTGFYDPQFGQDRQEALARACEAWASRLTNPTTITLDARFANLGGGRTYATYGSGGPTRTFRAFTSGLDPHVWYPSALADALAGRELKSGYADIQIMFNADIDGLALGDRAWHYDEALPTNDDLDFQTAAMHEIGHGLGFYTTFNSSGQFGQSEGYPVVYDTLLAGPDGVRLIDKPAEAENVTDAVFFLGTQAMEKWLAEGSEGMVPVYAPAGFYYASSLVHWDPDLFRGDLSLMRPYFDGAIRVPDNVTLGALADMGWTVEYPHAPEPSVMLILAGGMLVALRRNRRKVV